MLSLQNECVIRLFKNRKLIKYIKNNFLYEINELFYCIDNKTFGKNENLDISFFEFRLDIIHILRYKTNMIYDNGYIDSKWLKDEKFLNEFGNVNLRYVDEFPHKDLYKNYYYIIEKNCNYDDFFKKEFFTKRHKWSDFILFYIPDKYRKDSKIIKNIINKYVTSYIKIKEREIIIFVKVSNELFANLNKIIY